MFGLRYLKNVATLKLDQAKCNACRMCINVCPQNAIEISIDREKFLSESIDRISQIVDIPTQFP